MKKWKPFGSRAWNFPFLFHIYLRSCILWILLGTDTYMFQLFPGYTYLHFGKETNDICLGLLIVKWQMWWTFRQTNYQSINRSVSQSVNQSVNKSVRQTGSQSVKQTDSQSVSQTDRQTVSQSVSKSVSLQTVSRTVSQQQQQYALFAWL